MKNKFYKSNYKIKQINYNWKIINNKKYQNNNNKNYYH